MKLKAPFPWFGGKSRAASLIWERFGNPRHYIEPFAGSLAVLLGRPNEPKIETVNDFDCHLANFWRATKQAPDEVSEYADEPVNEADLHARHRWLVGQAEGARPDLGNAKRTAQGVHQKRPLIHGDRAGNGVRGRQIPALGAGEGHGVGVQRKRPILTGNGGSMAGVQRKAPMLNHGGGGGDGRGVHRGAGSRKRPGPQNTGAFGTLGAPGDNDLTAWFQALRRRLRRVRVCCGDWSRVVTPAVLGAGGGTTAVLLDPPYDSGRRAADLYAVDTIGIAERVREWAIENGDNPRLRIALCGLEAEHEMPEGWEAVGWTTRGGYGNQNGGDHPNRREVVWFSPHCIRQATLFGDSEITGPLFAEPEP